MGRHSLDLFADLGNRTPGSGIRWTQDADRVHQFLDRNG